MSTISTDTRGRVEEFESNQSINQTFMSPEHLLSYANKRSEMFKIRGGRGEKEGEGEEDGGRGKEEEGGRGRRREGGGGGGREGEEEGGRGGGGREEEELPSWLYTVHKVKLQEPTHKWCR